MWGFTQGFILSQRASLAFAWFNNVPLITGEAAETEVPSFPQLMINIQLLFEGVYLFYFNQFKFLNSTFHYFIFFCIFPNVILGSLLHILRDAI